MQTVYLNGEMGERFGNKWNMNVSNAKDIFKLIECQREGFSAYIIDCIENGIDFSIQRGEDFLGEEDLLLSLGEEDIIVTPIPQGSKGKAGKLIMAALLIAGGIYGLQYLKAGAGWTMGNPVTGQLPTVGLNAAQGAAVKVASWTAITLGTSLGLRTLAEILVPDSELDEEEDSHLFDGPQNTTQQGVAVPILYGEMIVGGAVINSTYNAMSAPARYGQGPGNGRPGDDYGGGEYNIQGL